MRSIAFMLAAFFASYAVFQLPVGHYVDKVGARIMFAIAGLWWSVFTATTALVQSVAAQRGMRSADVDEIVTLVDGWLVKNRRKG